MTLTNFRAIDFKKGKSDVKVERSTRDTTRRSLPEPTSKPVVSADPETVPNGTVPEIMTWVGEDVERAQKALDQEVSDEKPRKGLVAQLQGMIDSASVEEVEEVEEDVETEEEN